MAHRPRGNVTLTGYSNRPESLSYFLSEMRTIRESKIIEPDDEFDFSELEEGLLLVLLSVYVLHLCARQRVHLVTVACILEMCYSVGCCSYKF